MKEKPISYLRLKENKEEKQPIQQETEDDQKEDPEHRWEKAQRLILHNC